MKSSKMEWQSMYKLEIRVILRMCLSDFWTGYAKPYQSGPYLWLACFDAGTPITINFRRKCVWHLLLPSSISGMNVRHAISIYFQKVADVEIEYILAMFFLL